MLDSTGCRECAVAALESLLRSVPVTVSISRAEEQELDSLAAARDSVWAGQQQQHVKGPRTPIRVFPHTQTCSDTQISIST